MTTYPGLRRRLDQTADTNRRSKSGSKFTWASNLSSLACTEPYPLDPEIRARMALATPHELLEVFADDVDIVAGDELVYDSITYPVRAVGNWPSTNSRFLRLVIEDLKS